MAAHIASCASPSNPPGIGTYRSGDSNRYRPIIATNGPSDLRPEGQRANAAPAAIRTAKRQRVSLRRIDVQACLCTLTTDRLFSLVRAVFALQRREAPSDHSERASDLVFRWWRGQDLSLRASGYESSEAHARPWALGRIRPVDAAIARATRRTRLLPQAGVCASGVPMVFALRGWCARTGRPGIVGAARPRCLPSHPDDTRISIARYAQTAVRRIAGSRTGLTVPRSRDYRASPGSVGAASIDRVGLVAASRDGSFGER